MLKQDIVRESHAPQRAGQLVEATALLQRMLRGENATDATFRTTDRIALKGREPPVIDAKAILLRRRTLRNQRPATSARPRMLRASLNRTRKVAGFGLRGAIKRAPLSPQDIVPEGARFIEGYL